METFEFEVEPGRNPIHAVDARVKLLSTLAVAIGAVYIGRNGGLAFGARALALALIEAYLLTLALAARLDMRLFLKRLLLILPFGGTVALLKPLVEPGQVMYVLPLGITMTREGFLEGGAILMAMLVSATSVLLLSSTTSMQRILNSAVLLGLPRQFALLLGMTVRYLFLYLHVFGKMVEAQATRAFSIRSRRVGYRTILTQLGYTAAMLFVRAYGHGLRTYEGMLSRGYSADSALSAEGGRLSPSSALFFFTTLAAVFLPYLLAARLS